MRVTAGGTGAALPRSPDSRAILQPLKLRVPGNARSKAAKICSSRDRIRLIAQVHSWVRSSSKSREHLQRRENFAVTVDRAQGVRHRARCGRNDGSVTGTGLGLSRGRPLCAWAVPADMRPRSRNPGPQRPAAGRRCSAGRRPPGPVRAPGWP